jgi:hypothetical protein
MKFCESFGNALSKLLGDLKKKVCFVTVILIVVGESMIFLENLLEGQGVS